VCFAMSMFWRAGNIFSSHVLSVPGFGIISMLNGEIGQFRRILYMPGKSLKVHISLK
jgi:hypothetical protein